MLRGIWTKTHPLHLAVFSYGRVSDLMRCPLESLMQLTHAVWTGAYQVPLSHTETEVSDGMSLTNLA